MTCDVCGQVLAIGDHPFCPHGPTLRYQPFKAYFDWALGRQIDTQADRWRAQRELNVQPRDGFTKGDQSARVDQMRAVRRERARG